MLGQAGKDRSLQLHLTPASHEPESAALFLQIGIHSTGHKSLLILSGWSPVSSAW